MASHDKPKTRSNENLNLKNPIQDPNHKNQTTINEQKWKKMKKNMKNKPGKKYSLSQHVMPGDLLLVLT